MARYSPEEMLISAILRSGDFMTAQAAGLTPKMFKTFSEEWKFIQQKLDSGHRLPSKAAFKHQFPRFVILKIDDVEHWTNEVISEFHRQTLFDALIHASENIDSDLAGVVDELQTLTIGIQSDLLGGGNDSGFTEYEDLLSDFESRQEKAKSGSVGIHSGFHTIDLNTGGAQAGWLVVLAARLGQGKTWGLLKWTWEALKKDKNVLFVSLEQSTQQIMYRLHGFASHDWWNQSFNPSDLMKGSSQVDFGQYKLFVEYMASSLGGKLTLKDSRRGRVSPADVAVMIQLEQPDIVFIDYLTLLEMKGDGDYKSIGALTASLKQIAEKYQVPIVVAVQINRMGVGKEPPKVENLAGSDAIGQDSDVVVTLSQQDPGVTKLRLAKNRHGPDGMIFHSEFKPAKGIFEEISGDRAEEIMATNNELD